MRSPTANIPIEFAAAADQLRGAAIRHELVSREIAAPERIAPYAVALAAGVNTGEDDAELESVAGAGRFVLLYDPASADEWGGAFRVVCFAQAPLEWEIGVDPFISEVAWSWLVDALQTRSAEHTYLSGTATKTLSSGFGSLRSQGDGAQIELRASWTPLGDDITAHVEAWSELLCLLAGLPAHEGVESFAMQRARRARVKA